MSAGRAIPAVGKGLTVGALDDSETTSAAGGGGNPSKMVGPGTVPAARPSPAARGGGISPGAGGVSKAAVHWPSTATSEVAVGSSSGRCSSGGSGRDLPHSGGRGLPSGSPAAGVSAGPESSSAGTPGSGRGVAEPSARSSVWSKPPPSGAFAMIGAVPGVEAAAGLVAGGTVMAELAWRDRHWSSCWSKACASFRIRWAPACSAQRVHRAPVARGRVPPRALPAAGELAPCPGIGRDRPDPATTCGRVPPGRGLL